MIMICLRPIGPIVVSHHPRHTPTPDTLTACTSWQYIMRKSHAPPNATITSMSDGDFERLGLFYVKKYMSMDAAVESVVAKRRAQAESLLASSNVFRFAVVRHPWWVGDCLDLHLLAGIQTPPSLMHHDLNTDTYLPIVLLFAGTGWCRRTSTSMWSGAARTVSASVKSFASTSPSHRTSSPSTSWWPRLPGHLRRTDSTCTLDPWLVR